MRPTPIATSASPPATMTRAETFSPTALVAPETTNITIVAGR